MKSDIPDEVLKLYLQSITLDSGETPICPIDKTIDNSYSCLFKVKTRGLILAAWNCGLLVAWRDMYGAESLTQIAYMYLDIADSYQGYKIFNIILFRKYKSSKISFSRGTRIKYCL